MADNRRKTLILAVETSGRAGSVAIGCEDKILTQKTFSGVLRHNAELFLSIKQLLTQINAKAADVKQIYTTIGPGSFTGIRIGVSMAKMMALATKAGIIGVTSSDAIAQNAIGYIDAENARIDRFATIIDAKRRQFFVAVYEKKQKEWEKTTPDRLMTAAEFVKTFNNSEKPLWLLGEGLVYYENDFNAENINTLPKGLWSAQASAVYTVGRGLAKKGDFIAPQDLLPLYLRKPVAVENLKKDS